MPERLLDRRWPWLVAAGAIVLAFVSTVIDIPRDGDRDPRPLGSADEIARLPQRSDLNVLFILIDTLRADRLGCYGYRRDTSPAIDRLAKSGVRLARQLAQSSWTKASMASLWTANYPTRSGVTRFDQVITDQAELPAEILSRAGFQTVGLYRNGWVAPTFGFAQGYQVYKRPAVFPLPLEVKLENPTLTDKGSDEGTVTTALEFLRTNGRKRWYLYLHLMDVHEYLYDEESALFGSSHSDIYDNSIRHTDSLIDLLVDSLSEAGYRANTLIVVASDHGEAFGERGFDGHAREVFRETTEVPLVISFPFRLEPGIAVDARTRNVDVWPTILDLLGLAPPQGADGRSLVPEILALARGQSVADGRTAIAHLDQTWGRPGGSPRWTIAVAEGEHRYVRVEQPGGPVEQLFDRRDDPDERRDRSDEQPVTLQRLKKVAEHHLAERPPWGEAPTREIDELELNQLRALGYALP